MELSVAAGLLATLIIAVLIYYLVRAIQRGIYFVKVEEEMMLQELFLQPSSKKKVRFNV